MISVTAEPAGVVLWQGATSGQFNPFWGGNAYLNAGQMIDFVADRGPNNLITNDANQIDISVSLDGRVFGVAHLNGYTTSVVGELLEVEVWQSDNLVETLNGNYGPNGTFAVSPTVSGAAVLKFRFRTGLWKAVPVTLSTTPIENLVVNMTNGDCNHDNAVDIGDFALLSSVYGLFVGDPGYDTNADLNGDTTVDIGDYAILSGSYGEFGD